MDSVGIATHRYSTGAIVLHWLLAFALAAEIALGFSMPKDASGFALYQLHKSIGISILLLTVLRLGWRLTHRRPPAIEGGFTGFLASAVHLLFYLFMILAPLTGWAIVSTAPIEVPTLLFGVVPWPHLPLADSLNDTFEDAHEILAFIGLALFVLHVAGALRHHFLIRDALMARMAPGGKPARGLFLAAAVVALGALVFFAVSASRNERAPVEEPEAIETSGVTLTQSESAAEEPDISDDPSAEAEEDTAAAEEVDRPDADEAEEATTEPAGPPPTWAMQPGGTLRFSVANGGTQLNGSFFDWGGRIAFDPDNPETAEIVINVELGSASLGDGSQDGMLRGADFLSVASFPTATWRSTSVTALGPNRYRANGTLSLRGASRPQAVTFTLSGSGRNRSVTGSATIDRTAFGVGRGDAAADLAGNVSLNFAFDATR